MAPLPLIRQRWIGALLGLGFSCWPALAPASLAAEPLQLARVSATALPPNAQPAPSPRGHLVRVRLLEDLGLALRPAAESAGLRLRDGQGRVLGEWTGAPTLQLVQREGRVQVSLPEPLLAAEIWLEALALPSDPDPGLWLQQRRYRGVLQVRPQGSGLQVINHVPLETYLASVVGSEMPASWPLEALRAQAVAARTYALRSRRPAQPFDLKATVASQVYRGVETETPSTLAAVETTRGLVLTHDDALIDAVFHSSSGGRTESSGDLWPRQLPYLVSVPDFDHGSPVRAWRQSLDGEQLRKAFPELEGVQAIEVLSTSPTGRIRQARVVGKSGQLLLTGPALRSRLGLRSTWVRFEPLALEPAPMAMPVASPSALAAVPPLPALDPADSAASPALQPAAEGSRTSERFVGLVAVGRGFGHGIGMSQWGALALAQRGESFTAILRHYYRGTRLQPYGRLEAAAQQPEAPESRLSVAGSP